MAEITAALVKQLRDQTNVSMMECKRALTETNGDLEAAVRVLRERGIATAVKKSTRAANQGLIASVTTGDGSIASLVEVNCETDFVARNEVFQAFTAELASKACETDAALADAVKDVVTAKIAEIGEKIIVRRNRRLRSGGDGSLGSYIHLGGKVGVLVDVSCTKAGTADQPAFQDLVKDLTMHVAACAPRWLKADEVDAAALEAERAIFREQVKDKPAAVIEKIVEGKVRKYYEEVCLIEQGFVKEPKKSVKALLEEVGKQVDDTLGIRAYVRFQLGE